MSETFEIRAMGDQGVLLELKDNIAVHAVAAAARERFGDQLTEIVPGHRTLLLVSPVERARPDFSQLASVAAAACAAAGDDSADQPHAIVTTIPVCYDGEDLAAIARALEVDRERVIELHCQAVYTVAFMGFAPGFPYLVGLPPELELPRRDAPRLEVPAGSVAVAAVYCGIYPRASPGGWNLLGRTELTLFDPGRERPALLAPGDRVRFEPA
jgi:KipI family sensor histidine kinase inhibitor